MPSPVAAGFAPPARPKTRFVIARTVTALVLREMTTTYGRSPGGYFWAVAQPVAMIVILSFAFALLLRAPSLGTSFILFYASGILPLRIFQSVSGVVAGSLQFNKALLSYPRVTFMDSIIARTILALVTQIMVTCIVLWGIFAFQDIREILDFGPIVVALTISAILGLGIGVLNCFLFNMFPLWMNLWGILTRPLILVSAVVYLFEDLPKAVQTIIWYNPLVHITGLTRTGFYTTYQPQYISVVYVLIFSVIPLILGMLLLRRYHREIMHK